MLSRNPAAPLGEVATAADVGRTTLHRYFPERTDLIEALKEEAGRRLDEARLRARVGDETGASAIRRLCQEYFDLGDVLSLLFREQIAFEDEGDCDDGFTAMIERGHSDGSIDPELPATWISNLMWSHLYGGWSYISEAQVSRHEALRLVLRSIEGAVTPR
ncbi:TetR/AcrR family transcriptional regulator [Actinoplanes couchii]|uniref:TetR family transcriptional regulator n=1 Tax=Actinoplanes couchii TaxID=403638 RepID=A0ABQ3XGT5_9ACTN|nr:TetR family transcriptional regulator [Actinoplanes couchii]